MNILKKYKHPIILLFLLFFSSSLFAEWEDLMDGEKKAYGSEKEEKYSIDLSFILEQEKWQDHNSLTVLGLFKKTDYPKFTSLRLFPLYYNLESKIDNREKKFLLIPFPYYSKIEEDKKLTITPFGFKNTSAYSTNHSLLYLFYFGENKEEKESYNALFPIYKYTNDNGTSSIGSLLFSWEEDNYFIIWPLLSFNWKNFMINPLFAWEKHAFFFSLPLLIFNWNENEDHSYDNQINLVYSWERGSYFNFHPLLSFNHYGKDYTQYVNPLFYYYNHSFIESNTKKNIKTFFFPIIPVLWYQKNTNLSDTYQIFSVFRFTHDKYSENRSSFSPLHYFKKQDNSSLMITPLFYHSSELETKNSYTGILPLFYSWQNDNNKGSTFIPLYFANRTITEESLFASPIFYNYSNEKENIKYRGFLPIYFSWQNSENNGALFLPFYFKNSNEGKSTSINIIGLVSSYSAGPFQPNLKVGRIEDVWFLDFKFSWLYKFLSIYKRVPLNKSVNLYESTTIAQDDIIAEDTLQSIQNSEAFLSAENNSMKNSLSFHGLDFAYGLFSYQRADHKRHLRLLPLAWFTWYDNSENKANFIPGAYFSYQKDDLKYFILMPLFIPIYGAQNNGLSHTKSYGLTLFWDIYDESTQTSEKHVLWPIFKTFESPTSDGWRLFPLIWHSSKQQENLNKSSTFSTLLYYSSTETLRNQDDSISYKKSLSISPLFIHSSNTLKNTFEKKFFFPIIPLYYHYRSDTESSDRILYNLFAHRKTQQYTANTALFGLLYDRDYTNSDNTLNWIFPLYAYSKTNDEKSFSFPIIPLYYHYRSDTESSDRILYSLFAHRKTQQYTANTALFGLFYDRDYNEKDKNLNWILPFYLNYQTPEKEFTFYALNAFSTYRSEKENKFSILWPLFSRKHTDTSISTTLFPIMYTSTFNDSYTKKLFHISPFAIINKKESLTNNTRSTFFSIPLLLQYANYGINTENNTFNSGFLLGLYFNDNPEFKRTNFMFLIDNKDFKQNDDYQFRLLVGLFSQSNIDDTFKSSLFPIYLYSHNDYEKNLLIVPLLSYNFKNSNTIFDMYGAGLIWLRYANLKKNYETKLLFLGTLYGYQHKPTRDYTSHSSLWGLLWEYEYEKETDFTSVSVLKFLYKRVRQNGFVKNKILGITVSKKAVNDPSRN